MATVFNQPLESITDDAEIMAVPGWDSLGHARLMSAIEEEFDIQLTTEAVLALQSLPEIVEYLQSVGA
jgi:acyl carrier protein